MRPALGLAIPLIVACSGGETTDECLSDLVWPSPAEWEGDVTRPQVPCFCEEHSERSISGDLQVAGTPGADLSDLTALSCLTEVGGSMRVTNVFRLQSLAGLESLTRIGEGLTITRNFKLKNLVGLGSLAELGTWGDSLGVRSLEVSANEHLTTLQGLDSLTEIPGTLWVEENLELRSLAGLDRVTRVGGTVSIDSNPLLATLTGLEQLGTIDGNLWINGNATLADVRPLYGLTYVGGNVVIMDNELLTDQAAWDLVDRIDTIDGSVTIERNCKTVQAECPGS